MTRRATRSKGTTRTRRSTSRRRALPGRLRKAIILLGAGIVIWVLCRLPRWPQLGERHPDLIVIHHSATPPSVGGHPIDAAAIDAMHACRGFQILYEGKTYHIGYHYVVLQDGTVQPGRPEAARGAHARRENDHSLGICLVGDFASSDNPRGKRGPVRPTPAQMRSLLRLCADLERRYGIPVRRVVRHRDVGQTECPGDRFPLEAFRSALRRELGPDEPKEEPVARSWWGWLRQAMGAER